MLRTHTCGELKIENVGTKVALCGWVLSNRDLGGMTFIDLRDRYGVTQLVFNMEWDVALCEQGRKLGREFVIQIEGEVVERSNKNPHLETGDIEVNVASLKILSASKLPPFLVENETDGGEDLRMSYRYLDLRRGALQDNLILRHKTAFVVRKYLSEQGFLELETPFLIKSTPEGARDFVVPSRIHPQEFYALPQSPQTFKQLFMIAGYDKYFQLVRCFRDEDLRADRQPEFTQIDCEMSFVERDDILGVFEKMIKQVFKKVKGVDIGDFPRMSYDEAMSRYGNDKPDIRFGMEFVELNDLSKGKGFKVFDDAELVVGICVPSCGEYSRKQLDELTDYVKRPQVGAKGLVWVKYGHDGQIKSSVDKFFSQEEIQAWCEKMAAKPGDLLFLISGAKSITRKALSELRLEMGRRLGLMKPNEFKPLWVVDFPLLEWDDEAKRFHAMHHPFTSPKTEDIELLDTAPEKIRANAYDMVMNGVELGGGSIRINDPSTQNKVFSLLGFSEEEIHNTFGFLLKAFQYGVPPHGGIAFGFDRLVAMLCGTDSIRDVIAFPKNNAGRDTMIDAPSNIDAKQLDELHIKGI